MKKKEDLLTDRDRQLRRRGWLMLYLPMTLGFVIALALMVATAVIGLKEENLGRDPASAWGDASAILVMVQILLLSVVPLAIVVGLCALMVWLYRKSPPVLRRGQEIAGLVSQRADQVADRIVGEMGRPYSLAARVRALRQFLRR